MKTLFTAYCEDQSHDRMHLIPQELWSSHVSTRAFQKFQKLCENIVYSLQWKSKPWRNVFTPTSPLIFTVNKFPQGLWNLLRTFRNPCRITVYCLRWRSKAWQNVFKSTRPLIFKLNNVSTRVPDPSEDVSGTLVETLFTVYREDGMLWIPTGLWSSL